MVEGSCEEAAEDMTKRGKTEDGGTWRFGRPGQVGRSRYPGQDEGCASTKTCHLLHMLPPLSHRGGHNHRFVRRHSTTQSGVAPSRQPFAMERNPGPQRASVAEGASTSKRADPPTMTGSSRAQQAGLQADDAGRCILMVAPAEPGVADFQRGATAASSSPPAWESGNRS